MTNETLEKGNELSSKIHFKERSISDLKKILKYIDLDDRGIDRNNVEFKIENGICSLPKEKVKEFLWGQLREQETNLEELNKELEEL